MSALLFVFVLTLMVVVIRLQDQQQDLVQTQQTVEEQEAMFTAQIDTVRASELVRAQMLAEIQEELARRGIRVEVDETSSVLSIPTSLLGFDSGSYEIASARRQTALTIGQVVADVVAKDDRYRVLDTVFVEGHTDNTPHTGLDGTGNWGLSTFRAISLWRVWESGPGAKELKALRSEAGEPLFSVSGYGETRPVEPDQSTEAAKAKNRRIDLRFTVVRPTADDLAEIIEHEAGLDGTED
ncbi:OmpA family protein [Myceligenerans sp. I2]|uniref:OmpA family protein n=2 Tax=Myceligenerans indicum TaxID=2593663 RepID=A0ABS1LJF0_9MICO|nr:OmpA family protein [Myceligenerans indicum]